VVVWDTDTPDLTPNLQPLTLQEEGQLKRKSTSSTLLATASSHLLSQLSGFIASSMKYNKPLADYLTLANFPEKHLATLDPHHICKSFTIPKGEFCVGQLVLLANVAHEHHPNYDSFGYQCYRFSAVIYEAILKMCQKKHPKLKEVVYRPGETGKFGRIHVRLGRCDITSKVTKMYKVEWEKTKRTIRA
jgi:hypothetical protein